VVSTDPQAKYCPHCGSPFWPTGAKRLLTGYEWLDILLGALAAFVSPAVFGIGFLLAIVCYFALRDTYPAFARGLLIVILTWVVIVLGAFVVCIVLMSSGRTH
jgi:hypothetical protein